MFRPILMLLCAAAIVSCQEAEVSSHPDWVPISKNEAVLEMRDLEDTFLFNAQVIDVKDFHKSAYSFNSGAKLVKLRTNPQSRNLEIYMGRDKLISFQTTRSGRVVNFATPQPSLKFKEYINTVGGAYSGGTKWIATQQTPRVENITQNHDMAIIDVTYFVQQSVFSRKVWRNIGKSGSVTIRYSLVRQQSLDTINNNNRTAQQGYNNEIGYFTADGGYKNYNLAIRRFNIDNGKKITFHLKDFPEKFMETARQAVLSWNEAFGDEVIEVAIADTNIDVGDPRYNVIRWIRDGDGSLGWAGTAGPTLSDPKTGTIYSGGVFINGDYLVNAYSRIHATSQLVFKSLDGIELKNDAAETPVLPIFTKPTDFDTYIQGYYYGTIVHEVGHVLGLMHNFKGSINPISVHGEERFSNSIMEYLPKKERSSFNNPGLYDFQAIRWGYYGDMPETDFAFCTHGYRENDYNCLKGDAGDPIAYTVEGIQNTATVLNNLETKELGNYGYGGLVSQISNAIHIFRGLPEDSYDYTQISQAISPLCNLTPSDHLGAYERASTYMNITKARDKMWTSIKMKKESQDKYIEGQWDYLSRCFEGAKDLRAVSH